MTNNYDKSLNTNFNQHPYYDDFDPEKNYVRILHKPGVGDQVREQTQAFTINQFQTKRIADHLFKEGSLIRGGSFNIDNDLDFIRIKNKDKFDNDINIENFKNLELIGENNNTKAIVIDVVDGDEISFPDTKTLYIKYSSGDKIFERNENINSNNNVFKVFYVNIIIKFIFIFYSDEIKIIINIKRTASYKTAFFK